MIRINKYIASSGCCSRRKAEELIKEGKVFVNGKKITDLSFKINPEKDIVKIDDKIIKPVEKDIFIKIYKPRKYLTQLGKDKFGRKTLSDLLQEIGIKEKVFPVGRLDYDSEGLLILTNNGEVAYKLSHPKFEKEKVYDVLVDGIIKDLEKLQKGIMLEDGFFKPDDIKILRYEDGKTWLRIKIHSGKKRIIRRFMDAFGHKVLRLIRIKMDNIELGNLKPKEYRFLTEEEIKKLKR